MDQYIGKMLDNRYEILECIGTGGMAVVYKARCHRLNRLVAIKVLKSELASDAEFRRRFHDESQAVAMLSHTNIVAVYDVSRSDDLDYIVMELIDGLTLKQYMHKRGAPLNWREALHFITQIVRALGHAHSRGIIHRDIKPQNIMVLRDGSVKVTDFGIARVASAAQATLTQEALGSVHYISPEQARGSHIDGRSDLYSAGVVLYEMLTGRLPFEGETPVSVAIQHINSIPISPRELNPGIPPALEAITLKAMAPKLENRYASADEMLAELEEFRKNPEMEARPREAEHAPLLDEPTRVVPVSDIKQESQRLRRQSRGEAPPEPVRRERRREQPEEYDDYDYDDEPRRRGVPPFLIAILAILVFVGGMVYFAYNYLFKDMFVQPQVEEFEVPDVTIFTIDQLQQNPGLASGFEIQVGETVNSDEHPENSIIDQDPKAGTMVKEGESMVITVTVSAGEEIIFIPDVVNVDSRKAASDLREMGLVVETEQEYHDDISSGYVIRSVPSANTGVKPGDTVTLVVSQGREKDETTVITFLDMDINAARSNAKMLGLVVDSEIIEEYNDEFAANRVFFQSIAPNEVVEKGTVISFKVSLGPEPAPSEEPSPIPSEPVEPSESMPSSTPAIVNPKTKTIEVDLRDRIGTVHVRVIVDNVVCYDSQVDTANMKKLSVPVMGTGVQSAEIYIDSIMVDLVDVNFDE